MKDALDIAVNTFAIWLALWLLGHRTSAPPAPQEAVNMEAEDSFRVAADDLDATEPTQLPVRQPATPPLAPPARPVSPSDPPRDTAGPSAATAKLRRHATLAQASEASIASGRPILVMFAGAPGTCPKCTQLLEGKPATKTTPAVPATLADLRVIDKLNSEFEFVVVYGDEERVLADQFGVREYPTFAVAWPLEQRANKFIPLVEPAAFLEDVTFAKKGR